MLDDYHRCSAYPEIRKKGEWRLCELYPGVEAISRLSHIASLACPKPMLFINGTKDKLFPVPGVKDAFSEMHQVWKSQGVDNLLDTELWEIPHSCGLKAQEKMLEFLDKNLK